MKRWITGCMMAASLLVVGVVPAGADQPTQVGPFEESFDDEDPCTGLAHTVTIAVTFSVHFHDDRRVAHGERTLSTSSGFSGAGTSSFVDNGRTEMFRFTDMLTNDSGDRIRANGVFVVDLSNGIVRVDRFKLACLGS